MATEKELLAEIEALKKKLEVANNRIKTEKYGITWLDVPEAFEQESENQLPILTEVKEKAIKNEDGKPTHILIEGDNYHSLTCLNYTHKGKIDIIYIDPPYNTGVTGRDIFRYKDKRVLDKYPDGSEVKKDSPLRHSYWLSFMFKRLELAKELLADDGAIFISIDDNEVANLKLIMNQIFGSENFVGQWQWFKSATPPNLSHKIKKNVEYILGWERKKNNTRYSGIKKDSKSNDPITKPQNSLKTLVFPKGSLHFNSIEKEIIKPGIYGTKKFPNRLLNELIIENNKNTNEVSFENRFTWEQKYLEEQLEKQTQLFVSKDLVISYKKADYNNEAPPNLIDSTVGVSTTEEAGKYLLSMFGKKVFDYPKPVDLLKYILRFKKSNIVLDFFAGSGTTAQAVLELNEEEKSKRQFILATNNENNIMDDVCYPRVKKVIEGYQFVGTQSDILFEKNITWSEFKKADKHLKQIEEIVNKNADNFINIKSEIKNGHLKVIGEKEKDGKYKGLGNSLKFYKTDFVGSNNILSATDEDKSSLAHKAGYLLAIAENTLEEIELSNCFQLFENDKKVTAIYFKEEMTEMETFLEKVESVEKPINLYLFSWGNKSEFEALFDHLEHITVKTIPQPILEIYKKIYNIVTI
jgi:adenine-specific DNA-methyltransferase